MGSVMAKPDSLLAADNLSVPTQNHRGRRTDSDPSEKVKWVVIHSAICCDGAGYGAENLAKYLRDGAGGRRVSWHYNVDSDSIMQSLDEAWMGRHTGSQLVDKASIAIEMAVNIVDKEEWLRQGGNYHKTLHNTARLTADICKRHNLPPEPLSAAQLKRGDKGVISHNLSRIVYGGTTHYDPGPFPWDTFHTLLRQYTQQTDNKTDPVATQPPTNQTDNLNTESLIIVEWAKKDPWGYLQTLYRHHLNRQGSYEEITTWLTTADKIDQQQIADWEWAIGNSPEAKKR